MATITIAQYDISAYATIQPYVTQKIRSESITYALNGSMLVDRVGQPKKKITVTVGSMPVTLWNTIKSVLSGASFSVVFNDGNTNVVNGTFHCMSEIPDNYIYFGQSASDPTLVGGFSLEMEEV